MFRRFSFVAVLTASQSVADTTFSQARSNPDDMNGYACEQLWAEAVQTDASPRNWKPIELLPSKTFMISDFSDDSGEIVFGLRTVGEAPSRSHLFTMDCNDFVSSISCGDGRFFMRKDDGVFAKYEVRGELLVFWNV